MQPAGNQGRDFMESNGGDIAALSFPKCLVPGRTRLAMRRHEILHDTAYPPHLPAVQGIRRLRAARQQFKQFSLVAMPARCPQRHLAAGLRGMDVIDQRLGAARPILRIAPAGPAVLDRFQEQGYGLVVARQQAFHRCPLRRDARLRRQTGQTRSHFARRADMDLGAGPVFSRPRRGIETQAVEERRQDRDQFARGLCLPLAQQPGHHSQRRLLGHVDAIVAAGHAMLQLRNPGLAQEVGIEIAPLAAGLDAGEAGGQFAFEPGQRPAREQGAGGEAARGDIERHPVRDPEQRSRRPIGGGTGQRLRQHLLPAGDAGGRPVADGRVHVSLVRQECFREHGGGVAAAHPERIRSVIHDACLA
ncbi:hypothetical protein D3C71_1145590 [compost metagenome]